MNKLLVITGPTATGKTKLGIDVAKKFNGEIISADSRQVYKGNDAESGKDRSFFQWGIDIVEPDYNFNVSEYVKYAKKVIENIWAKGKLPIIVGGSGQYIKELLYPSETLHIPPNKQLREKLEKYSVSKLQDLVKIKMNASDWQNPRRLIRAIEVAKQDQRSKTKDQRYNAMVIGLFATKEEIYKKIAERRVDRPDLIEKEFKLAKKQITYLKKLPGIMWFDVSSEKFSLEIFSRITKWYT